MDRLAIFALGIACALAWNAIIWIRERRSIIARRLVARGALLIDARSHDEFDEGHVDGALNVTPEAIVTSVARAPYRGSGVTVESPERPLVVYASTHAQSRALARHLRDAGHRTVHDLGVMSEW